MEVATRTCIRLSAAILAVACVLESAPRAGTSGKTQETDGKKQLAAALAGRTAGPPQDCVNERDLGDNQSYGKGVVVFKGRSDDVLYVNRPAAGCPGLALGRALRTKLTSGRLCRGDLVIAFDPISGVEFGTCALGEFTPYRRAP